MGWWIFLYYHNCHLKQTYLHTINMELHFCSFLRSKWFTCFSTTIEMVCMVQVQAYLLLQTKSNFFDWQERIANQRDVSKCKIWSFICIKMCIMYAGIVLIIGLIYFCGPRWIITCLKCGRHLFRFLFCRSCIIYIWLLLFGIFFEHIDAQHRICSCHIIWLYIPLFVQWRISDEAVIDIISEGSCAHWNSIRFELFPQ